MPIQYRSDGTGCQSYNRIGVGIWGNWLKTDKDYQGIANLQPIWT